MPNRFAWARIAVAMGIASCGGGGGGDRAPAGTGTSSATSSGGATVAQGAPSGSSGATTSGASAPSSGGSASGKSASASSRSASSDASTASSSGRSTAASSSASSASGGSTTYTNPFGCKFAWGEPAPSGSLSGLTGLQFVTSWAGYEITASGSITSCVNCTGFLPQVAPTSLVPVYYAYLIGYYGHANGFPDANLTGAGQPSLTTGAGALLLGPANAACPANQFCDQNKIVQAYAYYAQQTHAAWPTKPLVWLLEGDFVQYTDATQTQPLTMSQLGDLAALITTAIKTNMPNAIVAIDQSNWNTDDVTNSFWQAMSKAAYDMVWTTGVANDNGFLTAGTTSTSYNGATAKYSYLSGLTGRKIYVDQWTPDTWTNQTASTIDALIAAGVVALNSNSPASGYAATVGALESQLAPTCP